MPPYWRYLFLSLTDVFNVASSFKPSSCYQLQQQQLRLGVMGHLHDAQGNREHRPLFKKEATEIETKCRVLRNTSYSEPNAGENLRRNMINFHESSIYKNSIYFLELGNWNLTSVPTVKFIDFNFLFSAMKTLNMWLHGRTGTYKSSISTARICWITYRRIYYFKVIFHKSYCTLNYEWELSCKYIWSLKKKSQKFVFKKQEHLKIGEGRWGLANCVAAYFRKAGGSLCFGGCTTNNQRRPSGLQTLPLYSTPCSPLSLGESSTWP